MEKPKYCWKTKQKAVYKRMTEQANKSKVKFDKTKAKVKYSKKDTVAKVAEEFRTFRELTFNILGLLRRQITECVRTVDMLETRQRRKTLIFSGIPECERENCTEVVLGVLHSQMGLKEISQASIKQCHRLGSVNKDHRRPMLMKFACSNIKSTVWKAKKKLKGSSTSVKEFLTKTRQSVFGAARQHFGMKGCWTQGTIVIKAANGQRFKITSSEELKPLLEKYPRENQRQQSKPQHDKHFFDNTF